MQLIKTYINHEQRKKIFALARQAGINNDALHQHVKEWTGESSLGSSMPAKAAHTVIECLHKILGIKPVKQNKFASMSEAQRKHIDFLCSKLHWNDKRLNGFIRHTLRSNVEFKDLKIRDASVVITGLKNYCRQQNLVA